MPLLASEDPLQLVLNAGRDGIGLAVVVAVASRVNVPVAPEANVTPCVVPAASSSMLPLPSTTSEPEPVGVSAMLTVSPG